MYGEPVTAVALPGHAQIDARSLALGRLIARRLCERPKRLDLARTILNRWRRICAPNVQATLAGVAGGSGGRPRRHGSGAHGHG